MKKIILTTIGICFLLLSCENESLEYQEEAVQEATLFSASISSNSTAECVPDLEALELSLPNVVSAQTIANPGNNAYFDFDILNTDLATTDLAGWCVDVDLDLGVEGPLNFNVYSSYGNFPADKFENPQNFPLVNWIMNQNFIGKESPTGGNYTFGHVQWAVWELIDDNNCALCTYITNPTGTWVTNATYNREKAREIVQAALDNGEGFTPGCGQKVAILLVPEGKQSIFYMIDVPEKEIEEECDECEGKVTELELQFNGDEIADILVTTKGKGKDKEGAVVFEGTLSPGDIFSFIGNDKKGTLGTEITISVNGNENTKIHTSCSKPIGPGLISGDFEVISGSSREGGNLCPVDTPPGGGDDCSECDGKITRLDLLYNGGSAALIEVVQKKEGIVVFSENVSAGEIFTFSGEDKKGTLGTEIIIYVNGNESQRMHTSCSVGIGSGAVFGDFTVFGGASRNGGELCPVDVSSGGGY